MSNHDQFILNLAFVLYRKYRRPVLDKELAGLLGINRSTANRLRHGSANPTKYLPILTKLFKTPLELWTIPHSEFVAHFQEERPLGSHVSDGVVRRLELGTIDAYSMLWKFRFDVHKGQYIVYWRAATEGEYMASLLHISECTNDGLRWSLINPYDNSGVRAWIYDGVAYPVADYLHFTGEHRDDARFEILNMLTTISLIRPPDLIYGCMSGIHVFDGKSRIAVNMPIVLAFQSDLIADWTTQLGKRLGRLHGDLIEQRIRTFFKGYPGIVTLNT